MISILTNLLFLIGFSYIILFFYSIYKQRNRLSAFFSILCLSLAIYIIGYGLELLSNDIEDTMFFLKLQIMGSSFMICLWFLFSFKFYYNKNLSWPLSIGLLIIPATTLFLGVTNEYHHLFYNHISTIHYKDFILTHTIKGLWYYVQIIYSYIFYVFGITLFFKSWRSSKYKLQTPAFWMIFGSAWPCILYLVYLFGFSPYNLDLIPFGLGVFSVTSFMAVFKFDFLELNDAIKDIMFSEIYEGIIIIDYKNRLIDYNSAAQKIFSCLNKKNKGKDLSGIEDCKKIIEHTKSTFEMKIIKDGRPKYYEFRVSPIKNRDKVLGYVYFIMDTTKQRKILQYLSLMASYDSLTEVYNRRRLMEDAEREFLRTKRYGGNLSVLIIDIDSFKTINDQYGHLAGDKVLRSVAGIFKNRVRATDILGRYGGEEFIILLPQTTIENAFKIAENIRKQIENINIINDQQVIHVTVSIGVATYKCNHENIQQLINQADLSLYKAKNNGKNQTAVSAADT